MSTRRCPSCGKWGRFDLPLQPLCTACVATVIVAFVLGATLALGLFLLAWSVLG